MTRAAAALAFVAVALAPGVARGIPRFAARAGVECSLCHVSPSGGGARTAYGRNVFARTTLPMFPSLDTERLPIDLDDDQLAALAAEVAGPDGGETQTFSSDLADWLALGGDARFAYIWSRPDRGLSPGEPPSITSSFFLMEAYAYLDAQLHPNARFVLQLGPYAGFEAWTLFRVDRRQDATTNLLIKAGYFYPAFGIREANHQLFTREAIGLGNADRDSGVELTGELGPARLHLGVFNGTLGGVAFDTFGTDRRTFEKALYARLSVRASFGNLRLQLGGSFAFNEGLDRPSPLFAPALLDTPPTRVARGLNELAAGGFFTAGLGPFAYLADLVVVRNNFAAQELPTYMGYASYQELSWIATRGLEVIGTFEFMDANVGLAGSTGRRVGLAIELFPWPFTELRLMVRRADSDPAPTGGVWDLSLQAHTFL